MLIYLKEHRRSQITLLLLLGPIYEDASPLPPERPGRRTARRMPLAGFMGCDHCSCTYLCASWREGRRQEQQSVPS
jgi:hypothetical protein